MPFHFSVPTVLRICYLKYLPHSCTFEKVFLHKHSIFNPFWKIFRDGKHYIWILNMPYYR